MSDEERGAEARGETAQSSPLVSVYPGESVQLESGLAVWVKPWGVKALMTEVPAVLGRLMGKLAPLFQMAKGGDVNGEVLLEFLMTNSAGELVEFIAWGAGVPMEQAEEMSAADFMRIARAVIRQNKSFFDQLGGLYEDLGQEIKSGRAATGSQSSRLSEEPDSPSTS